MRPRRGSLAVGGQAAGRGDHVTIDADPLWRLCTRGIEPGEARRHAEVDGDPRLAEAGLQMVSIIR